MRAEGLGTVAAVLRAQTRFEIDEVIDLDRHAEVSASDSGTCVDESQKVVVSDCEQAKRLLCGDCDTVEHGVGEVIEPVGHGSCSLKRRGRDQIERSAACVLRTVTFAGARLRPEQCSKAYRPVPFTDCQGRSQVANKLLSTMHKRRWAGSAER